MVDPGKLVRLNDRLYDIWYLYPIVPQHFNLFEMGFCECVRWHREGDKESSNNDGEEEQSGGGSSDIKQPSTSRPRKKRK